jgi:hypothetical protein
MEDMLAHAFPVLTKSSTAEETGYFFCDFSPRAKMTKPITSTTVTTTKSFSGQLKSRLHQKIHSFQQLARRDIRITVEAPKVLILDSKLSPHTVWRMSIMDYSQLGEQLLESVGRDLIAAEVLTQIENAELLSATEEIDVDYSDLNRRALSVGTSGINWKKMPSPSRTFAEARSFQYEVFETKSEE